MKKIIIALMSVMITVGLVGIGTYAIFSDTETSEGNTFTAGTLDLKVDDKDDPHVEHITASDIKPGDSIVHVWKVKNAGSIPGDLTVEIGPITSNDKGCTEPEKEAEKGEYGSATCGANQGELARFLRTGVFQSHKNVESPIGWGISEYHANNLTGCHPNGSPCGGLLYIEGDVMNGHTLGPDDFQMIKIVLSLDEDVVNDGAGWWTGHQVDDNIIQSDKVKFDIVFHLDQS